MEDFGSLRLTKCTAITIHRTVFQYWFYHRVTKISLPPPSPWVSKGHGWTAFVPTKRLFLRHMAFINNKRQDPKKWKTQYENLPNELIRLLGTYNNIKHKWKSHQDKYWEVNWVFGVHVVHVILKRCPATLAKDLCYSAAWYKMQIQMWWPTTDMTVDEKDKKTKAKNPWIDSVAWTW